MTTRPSIIESFNYAIEGVIHVLRTQRNMRIHFAIAVAVLVIAVAVGVSRLELIALLLSITFVLVAEMINTAVEGTIDAATTSFDPMAKLAKDIAAGAVLIAAVNAVAVGYLVFAGKAADKSADVLDRLRDAPAQVTLIALVLTVIIVIATKAWTGRGTPLRGGLPSGHAAVAFGIPHHSQARIEFVPAVTFGMIPNRVLGIARKDQSGGPIRVYSAMHVLSE